MTPHQILEYLRMIQAPDGTKIIALPGSDKYLFKIGTGAPTGTPDAVMYFNRSGTTTTTIVYVDVNGTWTALTIS